MSAAPQIINPQNVADIAQSWKGVHLVKEESRKAPLPAKLSSGDASSSSDELNTKVRKPYTITKQRERWTESEHQKFLEALKLYGRAWRRIEEYIGTKTAVQIRSHAQKFFCKLEREASTGSSAGKLPDIAIPPPRPKRKPNHPYPKKAGSSPCNLEDESKETSSLSSSLATAAAHPESFQSGSFNCMSQGLGLGTTVFVQSSLVNGHFLGPQGSVKIFGKTVVVPRIDKPDSHNNASKECSVSKDNGSLSNQSPGVEPKQNVGFSPFLKVRKGMDNSSEVPIHLDRNGPSSGATQSERTDESLGRTYIHELAGCDGDAADSSTAKSEECKISSDAGLRKVESGLPAADLKVSDKVDLQLPQGMNPAMHSWMDSILRYNNRISIPSIPSNGVADGASSSLSYWQLMQASAVNYAAYTAAMAAAAAAGWKANQGVTDLDDPAKTRSTKAVAPSIPSAWWPCGGFIPPVYFPPPGVFHQGEETSTALGNEEQNGVAKETPPQGDQPNPDLKLTQGAEISEQDVKTDGEDSDNKYHTKMKSDARSVNMLEASHLTQAYGSADASGDSGSPCDVDTLVMPEKLSPQGSDTETMAVSKMPRNMYSSCDEFEEGKTKGEGSSSGSNTPASRCHSADFDTQTILEAVKGDSYNLSEDNDNSCSEAFQIRQKQCTTNAFDLPKLRLKHAEKCRKHLRRDVGHGGSEDSKRFKSSTHDLELRKEVSQEGRKAFQALFSSKLLPQTFPSANTAGVSDLSSKDDNTSLTVCKNEARLNECIDVTGIFQGKNPEGVSANNPANLEMGNGFQGCQGGHPIESSNSFKISSSSGFVPYRRPGSKEPASLDHPSPLRSSR